MAGYSFFLDNSVKDNSGVQSYLQNWVKSRSLPSSFYNADTAAQVSEAMASNKQAHTLVAVGLYRSFLALVAQARSFESSVTLGYIPIQSSDFSRQIGIKDYKHGCKAIEQRKIMEVQLISVNSQYMLYDYTIAIEPQPSTQTDDGMVHITTEKTTHFHAPVSKIVISNPNFSQNHSEHQLNLEASTTHSLSQDKRSGLEKTRARMVKLPGEQRTLLRVPARQIEISAPGSDLLGISGSKLKSPLTIGAHQKAVRLIVARSREREAEGIFSS